ncbi:MAG: hypothetical protein ABSG15_10910, partial [FCB group bacterium]
TTTNTYRSFQQSWPRFRRDIYLTSKVISQKFKELNEIEKEDINQNNFLKEIHKVKYKISDFWGTHNTNELYYCNIDLTKFYPKINNNLIINNIKNYSNKLKVLNDYLSFIELIERLLKWEISYNGLNGIETEHYKNIQLDNKPINFHGIPTGLFVAGFLSNLALLDIDNNVNKKIEELRETEKRIAHFRFVDDHTFISTTKNGLFDWIEYYHNLLSNSIIDKEPCFQINFDKSKPSELAPYLIKKYNPDEFDDKYEEFKNTSLIDLKKKALKKMKLDPTFPTPLMNMTQEKISMINKTPFDMLDNTECQNLLLDVQHLLVTEFPDEEIRGDTRMSFAVSKLVNFVPKFHWDYTKIYEKMKVINTIDEEIKHFVPQYLSETKEQEKQGKIENLNKRKNNVKIELVNEKEMLNSKILNQNIGIFQLFLQSIKEHPDKIRLWKRSVEFWGKTGYSEIIKESESTNNYRVFQKLIDLIGELKSNKKINELTEIYLRTYVIHLFKKVIIYINHNLTNKNLSYKEEYRIKSLINILLDKKFLDSLFKYKPLFEIYYYKQTINLFKAVLSTFIFTLKHANDYIANSQKYQSLIEDNDLMDWENIPIQFSNNIGINFDLLVWYLVSCFKISTEDTSQNFIDLYLKNSELVSIYSNIILLLYPQSVIKNINIIDILIKQKNNKYFPFYWWYDLHRKRIIDFNAYSIKNIRSKEVIKCINYIKLLNKSNSENINIWIKDFNKNKKGIKELSVLIKIGELIDKYLQNSPSEINIVQLLKVKKVNENLFKKFPYNVFVNNDKLDLKDLSKFIINDKRYLPEFVNMKSTDVGDKQFIFAIGMLIVQLLSKDNELPNILYMPSNQLFHTHLVLKKLEMEPISSYTLEIINCCLSRKHRETSYFNTSPTDVQFDDDMENKLIINNVDTLKEVIDRTILRLEKNIFNYGKEDRLLIPIKLTILRETDFLGSDNHAE